MPVFFRKPNLVTTEVLDVEKVRVMGVEDELRAFTVDFRIHEQLDNVACQYRMKFGVKLVNHKDLAVEQRVEE